MHLLNIRNSFEDERGFIRDLVVDNIDSITEITFSPGAIRGNHVHRQTIQWTYVLYGELRMATIETGKKKTISIFPGDLVVSLPNEPHAFQSVIESKILVFTQGPRSGMNYEQDTERIIILK